MASSSNSNDTTDEWVQWIEDGIAKDYINYHDYDTDVAVSYKDGGFYEELNDLMQR